MSHKRVRLTSKGWWGGRRLVCCVAAVLWAVPAYAEAPAQKTPERFPVVVKVDFGPANKPVHEQRLMVDEGSTAKDVVSLWSCRINGSTKHNNQPGASMSRDATSCGAVCTPGCMRGLSWRRIATTPSQITRERLPFPRCRKEAIRCTRGMKRWVTISSA